MTYQEKYEELFQSYNTSSKALAEATEKIAFNGFGDAGNLANYFKASKRNYFIEKEFQKMLHYVTTENPNLNSEYVPQEYMYDFIKKDQQAKGVHWKDGDLIPQIADNGVKGFECVISLTNDTEIDNTVQGTEYKFPVLNIYHGRECYMYLAKLLQNGGGAELNPDNLHFEHIDEGLQVFVKIEITVWQ